MITEATALEPQVPTVKMVVVGGAHGFHLLFWQNPWGLLGFPMGLRWEYEGGRPLSTPASPTVTRLLKFCLQNNFEAKSNLKNRGKQCSHPLHCLGTLLVVSTNTLLPQYPAGSALSLQP